MITTTHTHAPDACSDCGACYLLAIKADRVPFVRASGSNRAPDAPVSAPSLPIATGAIVGARIVRHAASATKRARALTSDARVILGAFDSTQVKIGAAATAASLTRDLTNRVNAGEAVAVGYCLDRDVTGALPRNRMRVRPSQGSPASLDAPTGFPVADTACSAREAARVKACADLARWLDTRNTTTGAARHSATTKIREILSHWTGDHTLETLAISKGWTIR